MADTRDSERRLGFRNVGVAERRLLFRAPGAYIELRTPTEAEDPGEGAWLCGQVILPEGAEQPYTHPIYAVLQNEAGVCGAVRTTDVGDFALPFIGAGEFTVDIEPASGPKIRARFSA